MNYDMKYKVIIFLQMHLLTSAEAVRLKDKIVGQGYDFATVILDKNKGGIQSKNKKWWKFPSLGPLPPPRMEKYNPFFLASDMILSNFGKNRFFPLKNKNT